MNPEDEHENARATEKSRRAAAYFLQQSVKLAIGKARAPTATPAPKTAPRPKRMPWWWARILRQMAETLPISVLFNIGVSRDDTTQRTRATAKKWAGKFEWSTERKIPHNWPRSLAAQRAGIVDEIKILRAYTKFLSGYAVRPGSDSPGSHKTSPAGLK